VAASVNQRLVQSDACDAVAGVGVAHHDGDSPHGAFAVRPVGDGVLADLAEVDGYEVERDRAALGDVAPTLEVDVEDGLPAEERRVREARPEVVLSPEFGELVSGALRLVRGEVFLGRDGVEECAGRDAAELGVDEVPGGLEVGLDDECSDEHVCREDGFVAPGLVKLDE
jgi:hypothetical protein